MRPAEAAARLNPRQLQAVLELTLKQAFRPGLDPGTGARVRPLRQLVVSMGLFGGLFSVNVARCADVATFLALLFATAFVLVALAVNPDTEEMQQRRIEVLHSKPLAPATLLAARLTFLMTLAGLLCICFAAAPLLAATWWYGAPVWVPVRAAAALVVGGFSMAALWLSAVLVGLRWVRLERIRRLNQVLLLVLVVGVSALGAFVLLSSRQQGSLLSLSAAPALAWLPSSWFAGLALAAPSPLSGAAHRVGAFVMVVTAVLVAGSGVLDKHYVNFAERMAQPAPGVRRPLLVRVLDGLSSLRLLGWRPLHPQATAVTAAVLTLTRREDVSRVRGLAPQLIAVLAFVLGISGLEPLLAVNGLAYLGFAAVLEGAEVAKQTSQPAAGWLFATAPLSPRRLVSGLNLAVALRHVALPSLLLAILLHREHEPALALALSVGYLAAVRVVLSAALLVRPAWPLSTEQQATGSLVGFLISIVLTGVGGVAYAAVVLLTPLVGSTAVSATAAVALVPALVVARLLDWAAGRTVGRLEFPY